MAPNDFNAMCEGYENKQHSAAELMRQQTYMIVSPYLQKGTGYHSFKNMWKFTWEKNNVRPVQVLSSEQIESIKANHQRIIDKNKKK